MYIGSIATKSIEDNFLVCIQNKPIPIHTVRKAQDTVLEVDVECAWTEMGLQTSWANEVTVDIFMT